LRLFLIGTTGLTEAMSSEFLIRHQQPKGVRDHDED
jgi:hypothetical protein